MKRRIKVKRASCPCHVSANSPSTVRLRLKELDALYGNESAEVFLLAASPNIRRVLDIEEETSLEFVEYAWEGPESRPGLIARLKAFQERSWRCHFLWIADDEFEHFPPELLQGVKLGAISYFSGEFSAESLSQTLGIIVANDYLGDLKREEQFLDRLDEAERILFLSPRYGTESVFEHQDEEHWFSINGPLRFGDQAVLPTGEISTLTNGSGEFSFLKRFKINGEIVLHGHPIVHRGNRRISMEETSAAYSSLAAMIEYPVIAEVKDGLIGKLGSHRSGDNPFLEALERLFFRDERYRKIHEVGFGVNGCVSHMQPRNFFSNERYPGVHFGLGLGGHTSFHVDLVCPEARVYFEAPQGEPLDIYQHLGWMSDDPAPSDGSAAGRSAK